MTEYKVIITTSGIGSRLGNLTKFTNKSLVSIGNKYALSYIIENYPEDIELVITLGYYGNQVKDFLELAYPNRNFTFVWIDKYDGKGSSLGYSLLQTKKYVQCPFIYHACDCLIMKPPEPPVKNYIYGFKKGTSSQYATFSILGEKVLQIHEKGEEKWDYIYIGLSGIKNYKEFWDNLEYRVNNNFKELSDIHVMKDMLKTIEFKYETTNTWFDIGNMGSLDNARKCIKGDHYVLEKLEESICFVNNSVIKFFYNKEIVKNRVKRGHALFPLTPKILDVRENFYKYEFSKGHLLAEYNDMNKLSKLLEWCNNNLWLKYGKVKNFKEICDNFYIKKTKKRIDDFFTTLNIKDTPNIINGMEIDTIENLLKNIDKKWLCDTEAYQFHGDFILDNIIVDNDSYKLLDWRQDFGGELSYGDIYYDLAKLKHNLYINHKNILNDLFKVDIKDDIIEIELQCNFNLISQVKQLDNFIIKNGYDLKKVNLLTSLIWLNIAVLHHFPFSLFLFYFGKMNLHNVLNNNSYI